MLPKVLIVDDDPNMLRLAVLTFRAYLPEVAVLTANDGLQGMMKLFDAVPQVLVCDVNMPGPNGVELCQVVRMDHRLRGRVKTLVITGRHTPEIRAKVLREGASDYLSKPFGPKDLLNAVAALLPPDALANPPSRE